MKATHLLLALFLGLPASTTVASAQDGYDDLDAEETTKKKKSTKAKKQRKRPEVREIVKGFYAKSTVGGAFYLLDFRGFVYPGTSLGLSVGQDFVNQEKTSVAWEAMFAQGVHNGCHFEHQATYTGSGSGSGGLLTVHVAQHE